MEERGRGNMEGEAARDGPDGVFGRGISDGVPDRLTGDKGRLSRSGYCTER